MSVRSLILLLALASSLGAQAQTLRINGFAGYTFRERFDISGSFNARGVVQDAAHFGGGLEFMPTEDYGIEVFYQIQPTAGSIEAFPVAFGPYDINVNYIMLGGLRYQPFGDRVSGYGGLCVGAAFLTGDADASRLALGGRLGLLISGASGVGIKLGAQLFSPIQGVGAGLTFGTGGSGVSVSTYSSIVQFGFTGGLCFTLPSK